MSLASRETTEPALFVMVTAKVDPSSTVSAARVVNEDPVAPTMAEPFQVHW